MYTVRVLHTDEVKLSLHKMKLSKGIMHGLLVILSALPPQCLGYFNSRCNHYNGCQKNEVCDHIYRRCRCVERTKPLNCHCVHQGGECVYSVDCSQEQYCEDERCLSCPTGYCFSPEDDNYRVGVSNELSH